MKMRRVIRPLLMKELCRRNVMQPHPSDLDLHAGAASLGVPQVTPGSCCSAASPDEEEE